MYMYYIFIFIIFIIILFILFLYRFETFSNKKINYYDDIYSIKPTYFISSEYDAHKLAPFKILKSEFLNYPIRG